ncbi:HlyD family efflux transporter periplasmic adaptor subunit [Telmatospirillum sp.]|uniref:HlyD family efflux transporter periplasmic adaptor subunit n=1 Tax=Telmatospirillum sp. TaxID=2079197 RepID=UPI00284A97C3|nr:HlyD family efflux transporter periplasmic adaptor subunit [Telmatospirillum sp.]MDR3440649.1 HlyD family efflux transporter periplasmic adaptor subunit [Telmatospirillum sp.]
MTGQATAGGQTRSRLPPLREEIAIFAGPATHAGAPTWTLHDPTRNRFYRLGWEEFEILSRWDSADADALVDRVNEDTTLAIEAQDVADLIRFLHAHDLFSLSGPQSTAHLAEKAERQREGWGQWLLHNYLFTRIPLARPDRLLTAAYPYVRFLFSRTFALAIILIGLNGVYLVARQWDVFLGTFVDLFSVEGAVWFGLTLACLKVVHELGHAFTAKRYGCRVPQMGVALLVMVPMLYTDVNDAWKLTSRGQRLSIGLAGVAAELCCAALAASAWGLLPVGPARSVAFLVATSTWVTTLLINLSPFMRYDGYFVLSDWLEIPNLHSRAFALARWSLREALLGLGDQPPEYQPSGRRRFLIAFAYATWVYRFSLFVGIALIVYHFAVKIVGIAMLLTEVGFFIVRPILNELLAWWKRRADIRFNRRTLTTAAGMLVGVALLIVPWKSAIDAPAVLKSRQHIDVFLPEYGARIAKVGAVEGQAVENGAALLQLVSPDLDEKINSAKNDLTILEWQLNAKGIDASLLARSQVTEQEYLTELALIRGLTEQRSRLDVTAPIAGKAVDLAPDLAPGMWLAAKTRLLSVIDPQHVMAEAYVDEADLARIKAGTEALFVAEADSRIEVRLTVTEISDASTRVLADTMLASTLGGPVSVRSSDHHDLIPDRALYRVMLAPTGEPDPPTRMLRGHVVLQGEAASLIVRAWQFLQAVAVREGGA